jgi:hypothetical protein
MAASALVVLGWIDSPISFDSPAGFPESLGGLPNESRAGGF